MSSIAPNLIPAPKPSTVPMRVRVWIIGSRTPCPDQMLGLRDVGIIAGSSGERPVEQRRAEFVGVAMLPCSNRRNAVARARRNVAAALVEAAVTSHAANDQRVAVRMAREQVRAIEVEFAEAQSARSLLPLHGQLDLPNRR